MRAARFMIPPLPPVPENWGNPEARAEFFALLPKPLVVLIACDLAAYTPHGALGLKALETVRLWLAGQAEESDLRAIWEQIWLVILDEDYQHSVSHRVAFDAVWSAVTADAAYWANDISAPSILDRTALYTDWSTHYDRHRRRVVEIIQIANEPSVRKALALAARNSHARPLFWDAMLDAGYMPNDPGRKVPWRQRLARYWRRLFGKRSVR